MRYKSFNLALWFKIAFFSVVVSSGINAQSNYWPNDDPNWDWRIGDDPNSPYPATQYRMYMKDGAQAVVPSFNSAPWSQGDIPDGMADNRKEDGWVLLVRDFGTPTRAIWAPAQPGAPYFALYSRSLKSHF